MDFIDAVSYALNVLAYFVPILPIVAAVKLNRSLREIKEMESDPEILSMEQLEELERKFLNKDIASKKKQ